MFQNKLIYALFNQFLYMHMHTLLELGLRTVGCCQMGKSSHKHHLLIKTVICSKIFRIQKTFYTLKCLAEYREGNRLKEKLCNTLQ